MEVAVCFRRWTAQLTEANDQNPTVADSDQRNGVG